MKNLIFNICLLVCVVSGSVFSIIAQDQVTDTQVRVLIHMQRFQKDSWVGFGGWAVAPDITAKPLRGLVVGGVAFRNQRNKQWIEIMGGGYINARKSFEPVIDIRAASNKIQKLNIFAESLYTFKPRRLLLTSNATTPLFKSTLRSPKVSVGLEVDFIRDPKGVRSGVGPRVVVGVPKTSGRVSVTTSYQFGLSQMNIWRTYITLNL